MERADALWPRRQLGPDRLDLFRAHPLVELADLLLLQTGARFGVAALEESRHQQVSHLADRVAGLLLLLQGRLLAFGVSFAAAIH